MCIHLQSLQLLDVELIVSRLPIYRSFAPGPHRDFRPLDSLKALPPPKVQFSNTEGSRLITVGCVAERGHYLHYLQSGTKTALELLEHVS